MLHHGGDGDDCVVLCLGWGGCLIQMTESKQGVIMPIVSPPSPERFKLLWPSLTSGQAVVWKVCGACDKQW